MKGELSVTYVGIDVSKDKLWFTSSGHRVGFHNAHLSTLLKIKRFLHGVRCSPALRG